MLYKQSKKALLNAKIPSGTVIYDSAGATGSVTIDIPKTQDYFVRLVGGGAGGISSYYGYVEVNASGGAGGMVYGTITIPKGTYTATIGTGGSGVKYNNASTHYSGAGGNTAFLGIIAHGGKRATATATATGTNSGGAGGSYSVGDYVNLTGLVGETGLYNRNTGSGYASYAPNHPANGTYYDSVLGMSYGRGGGAVHNNTNFEAYKGGNGYLYIEAR